MGILERGVKYFFLYIVGMGAILSLSNGIMGKPKPTMVEIFFGFITIPYNMGVGIVEAERAMEEQARKDEEAAEAARVKWEQNRNYYRRTY